jgi:hypothetical protein
MPSAWALLLITHRVHQGKHDCHDEDWLGLRNHCVVLCWCCAVLRGWAVQPASFVAQYCERVADDHTYNSLHALAATAASGRQLPHMQLRALRARVSKGQLWLMNGTCRGPRAW